MRHESSQPNVWQLRRCGKIVARIHVETSDQPWLVGRFEPEPGFAALKPLFDREVSLVDSDGDLDVDALEVVQNRICQMVVLVKPDGCKVSDFMLHLRGDEASFRWSDEPLDGLEN